MNIWKKLSENIVEKVEYAGNQHFRHLQHCFLPFQRQVLSFESHLDL